MLLNQKKTISSRLFRLILGAYFTVALATTAVQLVLEFRHEKQGVATEITEIVGLVKPVLAKAIWDLDQEAIEFTVNALLEKDTIKGLWLKSDVEITRGQVRQGDEPSEKDENNLALPLYEYHYPLYYQGSSDKENHLADIYVYSDSLVVFERSKHIFYSTIINAIVKSLFLTFLFFLMIRRVVATPLREIATSIDQYDIEGDARNTLASHILTREDELGVMAQKLNAMQTAIREYQTRLLDYQKGLENQVDKKTQQLRYLATRDTLTGLINRREFESDMSRIIDVIGEGRRPYSLCFIDFDHFKSVNDTYGHAAGDAVLVQLCNIITSSIRKNDVAARMGGDEFCLLLSDCKLAEAIKTCEKIRKKVESTEFSFQGNTISITISMGLVELTANSVSVSQVLKDADAACYKSKEQGRNAVSQILSESDSQTVSKSIHWQSFIKQAMAEERISIFYQTIVSTHEDGDNNQGCEVLVRAFEKCGDVLAAENFITNAEKYNYIKKVDLYIIERAFRDINQRNLIDKFDFLSINLSGQTISSDLFIVEIVDIFQNHDIPYHMICFEITETDTINNLSSCTNAIKELKSQGVKFALDDFGSGLSSFNYLDILDVDYIKIDGDLVKDIENDRTKRVVVESINRIAKSMDKKTIAEHVENEQIKDVLTEIGVDYMQGYYFGKPAPLDEFIDKK